MAWSRYNNDRDGFPALGQRDLLSRLVVGSEDPEVAARLKIILDKRLDANPQILSLISSLLHFGPDPEILSLLDLALKQTFVRPTVEQNPFFLLPQTEDIGGPFLLGHIYQSGSPVGLFENEFHRHMAVFGSNGSGKSVFLKNLICQLARAGICSWFYDFVGVRGISGKSWTMRVQATLRQPRLLCIIPDRHRIRNPDLSPFNRRARRDSQRKDENSLSALASWRE